MIYLVQKQLSEAEEGTGELASGNKLVVWRLDHFANLLISLAELARSLICGRTKASMKTAKLKSVSIKSKSSNR
ncbi:hypothetical protein NQ774_07510 [Ochrobactrum sp. BD61]